MREKLIELCGDLQELPCCYTYEGQADYLIANGVTVTDNNVGGKWVSTAEMLPEEGTLVLCWYEYFRYGKYNRMFQTYGIGYHLRDGMWGGEVSNGHKTNVLAWQYLPEPPKGE